jgi:hypothetical protein
MDGVAAEAAAEGAIDAAIERDQREHVEEHSQHRDDCPHCEGERQDSADYTRCPACGLPYPDGRGDHCWHNPPYCNRLPTYPLGVGWGYLRGRHVTLVGRDGTVTGYVLPDQEVPDPHDYVPHMQMRRTDPGYEGQLSPFNPREWREIHPNPPAAG